MVLQHQLYVPNAGDGDNNSYKSSGGENTAGGTGTNETMYRITAAPIDGLSLAADYFTVGGTTGTNAQEEKLVVLLWLML